VEKGMNRLKLPETDSISELARFWDTHDLTDFEDQLEEVNEPVFRQEMETVEVPLRPQEVEAIKRMAESQGVEFSALVRGWVLEKLHARDP
jgi:predicted DNA binding CopG/RHH family protein